MALPADGSMRVGQVILYVVGGAITFAFAAAVLGYIGRGMWRYARRHTGFLIKTFLLTGAIVGVVTAAVQPRLDVAGLAAGGGAAAVTLVVWFFGASNRNY